MRFYNPTNGYVEAASVPFLWALLFGPFYFALKGIWRHVVLYFAVLWLLSVICAAIFALSWFGSQQTIYELASPDGRPPLRFIASVAIMAAAAVFPFLFYPFIATGIVRRHFLRQGWTEIDDAGEQIAP